MVHFAAKSFSKLPPHLLNELTAKRWAAQSGHRRAAQSHRPIEEVGRLKALTGHGEATHLLNDLTAKRAGG